MKSTESFGWNDPYWFGPDIEPRPEPELRDYPEEEYLREVSTDDLPPDTTPDTTTWCWGCGAWVSTITNQVWGDEIGDLYLCSECQEVGGE